jgi:hypothetical protein
MENQNDKQNNNFDQDKIMNNVNQTFENMVQDVQNTVNEVNQNNQQDSQHVMNAIDEAAKVFNNNNPWSDQ